MADEESKVRPIQVPLIDRKRYDPVGICIYCGAQDELTDEHIVPFGLGGNIVLPDSSCRKCAKTTSRIELTVLRGPLRPIRVHRGIQSRKKHRGAPKDLPLRVRYSPEGDWEEIRLPYEQHPLIVHFQVFASPGAIDPTYDRGIRVQGSQTFEFGTPAGEVLKRLGAHQLQTTERHVPSEFAKMTAKVGYAMAVAEGVIDPRRGHPEVVKSILEDRNDIGRWVGTSGEPRHQVSKALHFVAVGRDDEHGVLVARVQYLTDSGTPMYVVVLGSLDDEFVVRRER